MITWGKNRELVDLLSASGARFLVIGGTAVLFHAPERGTFDDLDLLLEPTEEAGGVLMAVMERLGGPRVLATSDEFAQPSKQVRERSVFYLDVLTPPHDFDFA